MFCPNSFNNINIGDSIELVKQQCGAPTSEKTTEANSSTSGPQEWVYYVKAIPNDQATLRTTFAFVDGKLTNINVNGMSVSTSQICGGNTTQIGDLQKTVESACGKPALINAAEGAKNAPANKIVELIYTGADHVTLIFVDGKLKDRK